MIKFSIGDKVMINRDNRPPDIEMLIDWDITVWTVRFVEDDRFMLIGYKDNIDRRVSQENYVLESEYTK